MNRTILSRISYITIFALSFLYTSPARSQELPLCHDPVVIKEGDTYFLFSTGRGIKTMTSQDLTHWQDGPPVFATPPAWAVDAVEGYRGHTWAPDILLHDGVYYLYYSVSTFGKNTSCIGVATSESLDPTSPQFGWTDHGPVVCSVAGQDNFNAIDPHVIIDDAGTPWLSFGSFWDGIKLVRLDPDMTSLHQPEEWYSISRRWNVENEKLTGPVEAPFIFRKGDFYYLFVSFDFCCRGADSDYKIGVGRSRDVRGPYIDRNGLDMNEGGGEYVITGNTRFPGVGHCSIYNFDGVDKLFFHGYDMEDSGRSRLLVRDLYWDDEGWPSAEL